MMTPIDQIEVFEPWSYMRGQKTVRLEDRPPNSPAPGNREFSESQVIDAAVFLGRWLVVISTGFEKNSSLTGIREFSFGSLPDVGETLQVKVTIRRHDWDDIILNCDISSRNRFVARGSFTLEEVDLVDPDEVERLQGLWTHIQPIKKEN